MSPASDRLTDERFARIRLLLGDDALQRLRAGFVTVVGLGAVGGHAVEGLARAGVGRLRLVDFDSVSRSNINRQLAALETTLGRPKAQVLAARVRDIDPGCDVEPLELFAAEETMDTILDGPPDLLIDAIDSVGPKVGLIAAATARGVPVLSSMGAAMRTDPTRVRLKDLADVTGCPLARRVRKKLRALGVDHGVCCVCSDEPVPTHAVGQDADAAPSVRGRPRRPLGSLPTLTGIFGLTLATEAIRRLANP